MATCYSIALVLFAHAQTNQGESRNGKQFKELMASVNATFTFPEGFTEVTPVNNDKTSYQYALELPNSDFEVLFQVNQTKKDWKRYDRSRESEKINPDSLYSSIADAHLSSLSGDGGKFNRPIPAKILQFYNADIGRSYFFTLATSPVTHSYQYGLMVIIQKNHQGSIVVTCFGNDRGPEFFKKVNMLRNCLKFNN